MPFFGVELNSQINKLIFEIRLQFARNKQSPNVRTLYRSFAQFDPECCGLVAPEHFEKALNANALFFKKWEIQVWQNAYGENGQINWFNFLSHLREPMGPVRRALVEDIFNGIDKEGKGKVGVEQLMANFNPRENEWWAKGRRTEKEVQEHLLSMLVIEDGAITKDEFVAFYDDLNINLPHNDIFIRYVSEQWHHTAVKHAVVKEEDLKRAVINLRYRLIEKSQATQDDLLIRKLFEEFDENRNYNYGPYDVDKMMRKLGLKVDPALTEAIHKQMDGNQSGFVELGDFKEFLLTDPYPL